MKYAFLVAFLVLGAFALAAGTAFGQTAKTWTAPKTPWGDPDLQGTWTDDDCIGTPMNRPANLGDRGFYTEQELADRKNRLDKQLQTDSVETPAPDGPGRRTEGD